MEFLQKIPAAPLTAGFGGSLAITIFDISYADEHGKNAQDETLQKTEEWLKLNQNKFWAPFERANALADLDRITPLLDGSGLLRFAKVLEKSIPEVFEFMPELARHRDHLARSFDFARLFVPAQLNRLINALDSEGAP